MLVRGYEVMEKYGAKWLKIFYHNSKNNVYFDYAKKEAFFSISNSSKYSIMKYLPRIYRYQKEKYEFILEYPGKSGYNRWSQRINPLLIKEHPFTGDIGFEEINLTWKGYVFSGLSQVNSNDTQFSCSVNTSYFHYSIGAYRNYGEKTFAGPRINYENGNSRSGFNVDEARVWIRVATFTKLFYDEITYIANTRKIFFYIHMLYLIVS